MTFEDFVDWVWSNNSFKDIHSQETLVFFKSKEIEYVVWKRLTLELNSDTEIKFKTFEDIINVINALNKSI